MGQQQLDHLHLFMRVVLRMARMLSMMMRMLLMTTVGAILNDDADGFGEEDNKDKKCSPDHCRQHTSEGHIRGSS